MRILSFIFLLSMLLSVVFLPSCNQQSYSDTVSCQALGNAAKAEIQGSGDYSVHDNMHIKYNLADTHLHDDSYIFYSTETEDINEVGIFHVKSNGDSTALAEIVEDYITDMQKNQRAFIESYAPNEVSKLDGARIYIFGNYVVYTILSPNDRDAVIEKIESLLK